MPWPADYGGVIDVYYRVKALASMGVKVHLHCYEYGRKPASELETYCEEVLYYHRPIRPSKLLDRDPFIVATRRDAGLLQRLQQDDYPILLEGLHCCWLLQQLRQLQPHRTLLVRAHNVEHDYYARLAKVERRWLKRPYLRMDARKLRAYEPVLKQADVVLAVTQADAEHFRALGCKEVLLMPSSHNNDHLASVTGHGQFALYHADLSVSENIHAARFLMEKVFIDDEYPLVIAGRNPHRRLLTMAAARPWVRLLANPSDAEMDALLREAHVAVLVTQQPTGLKLKLLNSLYSSRFCLVNSAMVAGTTLGEVCEVCDDADSMRQRLRQLFARDFTADDLQARRNMLGATYDNDTNAKMLITWLKTSFPQSSPIGEE